MLISNLTISLYGHVQSEKLNSAQTLPELTANNSKTHFSQTDSVTISNGAKELESIEEGIAKRYDVRNLSENERLAMAGELFDNNLITPTQYAVMSFPIEKMTSQWPGYEGTYDPNKKIDFLQQSIDQLAFANSRDGSSQETRSRGQVISVLENLNKLENS